MSLRIAVLLVLAVCAVAPPPRAATPAPRVAVPMASAAPAPAQQLRVAPGARWFEDGSQRVDYRELSAFSLYSRWVQGQQAHVTAWAARAATHDVGVLRVILTLGGPYWEARPREWFGHTLASGPHVPGFYEQLVPFVRAMAAQGLRVRLVLVGDAHMFVPEDRWPDLAARREALDEPARNRIRAYVRRVVGALAPEPTVIWEVANEYANVGLAGNEAFVTELGALVKTLDPDALMNYSAPRDAGGEAVQWMRPPADFVSVHVSRDRGAGGYQWLHALASSPAIVAARQPVRMPFLSGEPLNFGDTRRDGRNGDVEPSPAVAFAYGAASRVLQFSTTFHHDDGLWTAGWGERTERAMAAWRRGLDAVPMPDTPPTDPGGSASPWTPGAHAAGQALFTNGAHSVALGVKAGWDHSSALKAGRRLRVLARVADGETETVVFVEDGR